MESFPHLEIHPSADNPESVVFLLCCSHGFFSAVLTPGHDVKWNHPAVVRWLIRLHDAQSPDCHQMSELAERYWGAIGSESRA